MNKNVIAVNLAKIVAQGLKLFNFGSGTSMPGIVAKKVSPMILSDLVNQTRKEIIAVTGTNGKTTSSNFISAILKADNRKVAHNAKGANMLTGVTTAMVESADNWAKMDVDNSVLESDEAYLQIFADYFCADYLIVTNLFRDQLDRYGELDATAKMIKKGIDKFKLQSYSMAHHFTNPQVFTTILNADDPAIQCLADANTVFFGFEDIKFDFAHKYMQGEIATCKCGKDFEYTKAYYGQIGHYFCSCGRKRPETYLEATADIYVDYSVLHLLNRETQEKFDVKVNIPGVYNAYNALGAITLAVKMGISAVTIQKGFENYKTVFGRAETTILNGKKTIFQLIKNPVGAGEVLQTVHDDKNAKLLIIINDNYADGRDVSWLWDANFDILADYDKKIIVSGIRYADMAVRLKYAGINSENIIYEKNLKKALELALDNTAEDEKLYVLPTYTALLEIQKFINKFKK